LGLDLIGHPEIAETPETAVRIAVLYWTHKNLNRKADANDTVGITRSINGGLNGIDDRLARLRKLSTALGA
jgi:putative chitinase